MRTFIKTGFVIVTLGTMTGCWNSTSNHTFPEAHLSPSNKVITFNDKHQAFLRIEQVRLALVESQSEPRTSPNCIIKRKEMSQNSFQIRYQEYRTYSNASYVCDGRISNYKAKVVPTLTHNPLLTKESANYNYDSFSPDTSIQLVITGKLENKLQNLGNVCEISRRSYSSGVINNLNEKKLFGFKASSTNLDQADSYDSEDTCRNMNSQYGVRFGEERFVFDDLGVAVTFKSKTINGGSNAGTKSETLINDVLVKDEDLAHILRGVDPNEVKPTPPTPPVPPPTTTQPTPPTTTTPPTPDTTASTEPKKEDPATPMIIPDYR